MKLVTNVHPLGGNCWRGFKVRGHSKVKCTLPAAREPSAYNCPYVISMQIPCRRPIPDTIVHSYTNTDTGLY